MRAFVEKLEKMFSTAIGRDKLYRFLQSLLKTIAWTLQQFPAHADAAKKCTQLASGFSAGRRFLRIGHVPGALKGIQEAVHHETPVLASKHFSLVSRLFGLAFLLLDHWGWLAKQGLFQVDAERESVQQSVCAFFCTLFQILAEIGQYAVLLRELERLDAEEKAESAGDEQARTEREARRRTLLAKRRFLRLDFAKNLLDLPPTLNGARPIPRVSPIVWNLITLVSSIIGLAQSWPTS
jgi:hypothetical protein